MATNRTIEFFEAQFRDRVGIGARDEALSGFQELALPFVSGRVLDLACGLGTLSFAAARKGCEVVAVDSSPTAIAHVSARAQADRLPVTAVCADLEHWPIAGTYDTVVAIGILMFFRREVSERLLRSVQDAVRPGGVAATTVLLEGTTFKGPFDPERTHLFAPDELGRAFASWEALARRGGEVPSPDGTVRRFQTLVARKPAT